MSAKQVLSGLRTRTSPSPGGPRTPRDSPSPSGTVPSNNLPLFQARVNGACIPNNTVSASLDNAAPRIPVWGIRPCPFIPGFRHHPPFPRTPSRRNGRRRTNPPTRPSAGPSRSGSGTPPPCRSGTETCREGVSSSPPRTRRGGRRIRRGTAASPRTSRAAGETA